MNLSDLVSEAATRAGDKPALLHGPTGDERVAFAALEAETQRVAAGLQRLGVSPGERVAIVMGNVPRFAFAYFGILRAGAVAVPVNVQLTEVEIERVLRDADVSAVLASGAFAAPAEAAGRAIGLEHIVADDQWDDALGPVGSSPSPVEISDDDLAVLAYTSGTTGEPKGAMLTHGNLLANLRQQMETPDATAESDVLLLALPLFHIFGLNVALGLVAMNAATGVLVERFEPIPCLRLIESKKVTVVFGAPPMYAAWISVPGADQYDLSSVRLAISGAAPLPADVFRDFRDLFGTDVYEGYGLTETAPTVTSARMGTVVRPNCIGKPLPGIEVRLIDENGDDVEIGDPGEIVVRGPNVFKGYWRREEETARAFVDGWFRTGDIAVRDEDDYLYLVDRKRDLIIVSGFNVFPSEVEAALLEHPAVAEVAVVGVPHSYTGEAVKAYIVLRDGKVATDDDIRSFVDGRIARFKQPRAIEIVDELPHALSGKILRRALRT